MDDKDSKPAPSLSPATGTSAASTSKGGTKKLADKLSAQVKNYVDTGSGRKALEATLHFIKANSLRHNDAGKTFGSSGTAGGVLEALLSLTGQSSKGEEIEGLQCLAWSTLANLCAIDRKLQEKVINLALAEICQTLSSSSKPQILNPTCRTLANIIPHSSFPIWDHSLIGTIIKSLTKIISVVGETACLQSALRSLRKVLTRVNNASEHFIIHRTLPTIIHCMRVQQDEDLSTAVLSVLETCFLNGHLDLISLLWEGEHEGLSLVIDQVCVGRSSSKGISVLCHCAKHINGKAALSRAGGIELLTERFLEEEEKERGETDGGRDKTQVSRGRKRVVKGHASQIIDALCHCCRDVHGRQKVRDCGALQLLINLLQSKRYSMFHQDILSALICYYFDEQTLQFMIRRLGLIKSLLYHLELSTDEREGGSGGSVQGSEEEMGVERGGELEGQAKRRLEREDSSIPLLASSSDRSPQKSPSKGSEAGINFNNGSEDDCCEKGSSDDDEGDDLNEEEISVEHKAKKRDRSEDIAGTGVLQKDFPPISKKFCHTISDEESTSSLCYLSPPYSIEEGGGGKGGYSVNSPIAENESAYSPLFEKLSPLLKLNDDDSTLPYNQTVSMMSPPPGAPRGTSSPSCQAALEANNILLSPIPINFIDSLLSPSSCSPVNPSLAPRRRPSDETSLPQPSSSHSKVLLLLSRVSHLHDCQPILASVDVLSVILKYYLKTGLSDGHCFKVLSRLFSNPHCFQDCLVALAPSLLFHHMISASSNDGVVTDGESNSVKGTQQLDSTRNATSYTQCTTPQRALGYASPRGGQSNIQSSPRGGQCNFQPPSLAVQSDIQSLVGGGQSVKELCVQLLEKLSRIAESPYGQGVIAHMLLRGDNRDVMAGSLGLILLEKSHSICHKMLIDYGGLQNLIRLSQSLPLTAPCNCRQNTSRNEDENDHNDTKEITPPSTPPPPSESAVLTQLMSVDTLLFLSQQYLKFPSRKHRHSLPEKRPQSLPKKSTLHPSPDCCILPSPPPPPLSSSLCFYRDFDHWPFDTSIVLDNDVALPVHRRLLVEASEVFSVMFLGSYKESNDSTVRLRYVCPSSFESVVHHVYGCGFHCEGRGRLVEEMDGTESYSDKLIEEIVGPINEEEGQEEAWHFLRVMVLANQFFIPSLLRTVQDAFLKYLSLGNVTPVFLFSQMHQCSMLSDASVRLLVSHGPGGSQSDAYLSLVESIECDELLQSIVTVFHHND